MVDLAYLVFSFYQDLASSNHLEVGVAINGFSHILTPDLARDLCQDLVGLLNHSRPYVRKRAVLALYKVFLKFPEGLRITWPKLKEKLDDEDNGEVEPSCRILHLSRSEQIKLTFPFL